MAEREQTPTTDRDEIAQLIERVETGELREAGRQKLSRLRRLLLTLISVLEQKNLSI